MTLIQQEDLLLRRVLGSFDIVLMVQYAALGQQGLAFFPIKHSVGDPAQEDIQCHILGKPLEPSEIKLKEISPSLDDPDGIHNNKEGLGKACLISCAVMIILLFFCMHFVHVFKTATWFYITRHSIRRL